MTIKLTCENKKQDSLVVPSEPGAYLCVDGSIVIKGHPATGDVVGGVFIATPDSGCQIQGLSAYTRATRRIRIKEIIYEVID